jgi:hypothetical protein
MLQNIYGKNPENFSEINRLFHTLLGKYPAEKTIRALEKWLEDSQEFPTPADIVGIIKRNGLPPLSKEVYIALSKKDYGSRTPEDHRYMGRYEEEQRGEQWAEEATETKQLATTQENIALRQHLRNAKNEILRLGELLHDARMSKGLEQPKPSLENKITATVDAMRAGGAPEADVDEFLASYGVATAQIERRTA